MFRKFFGDLPFSLKMAEKRLVSDEFFAKVSYVCVNEVLTVKRV